MLVFKSGRYSLPGPLLSFVIVAVGVGFLAVFSRLSVRRYFVILGNETTPIADVEPGRVEGTVQSEASVVGRDRENRAR